MDAGQYNIVCKQGSTFSLPLTIDEDGTPWNVLGWTARMQVRPFIGSSTILLSLTQASGITLAAGGSVTINITGAQLSALPPGTHVYDLELVDLSNNPESVLEGKFIVKPEVTI